jgi:hypothetical protein
MQRVDDALKAINAPPNLNFFFLFFWAVTSAVVGGLIWGACQQLWRLPATTPGVTSTLGGSVEPHGVPAFLWAIVTNLPAAAVLMILALKYQYIPPRHAALAMLIMLPSLGLAALSFYDLSLGGNRGFRCYMKTKHMSDQAREFYLSLIWSRLLPFVPLVALYAANKAGLLVGPAASLSAGVTAVGLIVALTVASIGFFTAAYPASEFESARGVIAGVVLRVSLFLGFIVSCKP